MKQFGNPPKRTPPLSTNPLISEQFFHDPPSPLCPNFKNKNPPPLILGWGENYDLKQVQNERDKMKVNKQKINNKVYTYSNHQLNTSSASYKIR